MLEEIVEQQLIFYLVGAVIALGIIAKLVAGISLKRLVKAASNMGKSSHGLMRLVRAKFEHACMVSDKVQNVRAFVEKYVYEYRTMGIRLHTWRQLEKTAIWMCGILSAAGAGLVYYVEGVTGQIYQYGVVGLAGMTGLFLVHVVTDEQYQIEAVKTYMVDFLENTYAHRYEKGNQREIQVRVQKEYVEPEAKPDVVPDTDPRVVPEPDIRRVKTPVTEPGTNPAYIPGVDPDPIVPKDPSQQPMRAEYSSQGGQAAAQVKQAPKTQAAASSYVQAVGTPRNQSGGYMQTSGIQRSQQGGYAQQAETQRSQQGGYGQQVRTQRSQQGGYVQQTGAQRSQQGGYAQIAGTQRKKQGDDVQSAAEFQNQERNGANASQEKEMGREERIREILEEFLA